MKNIIHTLIFSTIVTISITDRTYTRIGTIRERKNIVQTADCARQFNVLLKLEKEILLESNPEKKNILISNRDQKVDEAAKFIETIHEKNKFSSLGIGELIHIDKAKLHTYRQLTIENDHIKNVYKNGQIKSNIDRNVLYSTSPEIPINTPENIKELEKLIEEQKNVESDLIKEAADIETRWEKITATKINKTYFVGIMALLTAVITYGYCYKTTTPQEELTDKTNEINVPKKKELNRSVRAWKKMKNGIKSPLWLTTLALTSAGIAYWIFNVPPAIQEYNTKHLV